MNLTKNILELLYNKRLNNTFILKYREIRTIEIETEISIYEIINSFGGFESGLNTDEINNFIIEFGMMKEPSIEIPLNFEKCEGSETILNSNEILFQNI
jgi:hypothetical protein